MSRRVASRQFAPRRTRSRLPEENAIADEYEDALPLDEPMEEHALLDDDELNVEYERSIYAADPQAPQKVARFHYRTQEFKVEQSVCHLKTHLDMPARLVHVESEVAHQQLEDARKERELAKKLETKVSTVATGEGEEEGEGPIHELPAEFLRDDIVLKNQFNYTDRSAQTFNLPMRNRTAMTVPPPREDYCGQVTQWDIFDTFVDSYNEMLVQKHQKEKKVAYGTKEEREDVLSLLPRISPEQLTVSHNNVLQSPALLDALRLMERMVNQNSTADTFHTFKYYEEKPVVTGGKAAKVSASEEQIAAIKDFMRGHSLDKRGHFVSLWRFAAREIGKQTVTCVEWNATYPDLFAVGYGTFQFKSKDEPGAIACFTLKNAGSHAEHFIRTPSCVLSLAFHPEYPSLLAVGMYNGMVCVYDITAGSEPLYTSSDPNTRHVEPVWQVKWAPVTEGTHPIVGAPLDPNIELGVTPEEVQDDKMEHDDDEDGQAAARKKAATQAAAEAEAKAKEKKKESDNGVRRLMFYSISGDGRVLSWSLHKDELVQEEVVQLQLSPVDLDGADIGGKKNGKPESKVPVVETEAKENGSNVIEAREEKLRLGETTVSGLASGMSFDFHRTKPHLFVCGTEEGRVQLYSNAYNTEFVQDYKGHHEAVYAVRWNQWYPDVFLTASADWTVKLWEYKPEVTNRDPLMVFDMQAPVADVAWAPYSSAVFAALTTDGVVRLFDLTVTKHEPIGVWPQSAWSNDTQSTGPTRSQRNRKSVKHKATKLEFNPSLPIISVADERGDVLTLKLSAKLRRMSTEKLSALDPHQEFRKLHRILSFREAVDTQPHTLKQIKLRMNQRADENLKRSKDEGES